VTVSPGFDDVIWTLSNVISEQPTLEQLSLMAWSEALLPRKPVKVTSLTTTPDACIDIPTSLTHLMPENQ